MPDHRLDIANAAGWPERSLGDVCELISRGTAPVYVEHSDVKAIGQRCVAPAGFDASKARPHSGQAMANVLRPAAGDVLLNSTGTGTIGRSCVFDGRGSFVVDGHVTTLRPSPGLLDGRWLNALLRSAWGQTHLERYCFSGSTNQVELNRLPLVGTRVPVPPLDEQRRSAEILDTFDTTIRQTEAIIEKLKQVKQGLLHDLLTRGIDANGELRPPQSQAPHLYKDSPLGWIPAEWQVELLDDVAVRGSGHTPSKSVPSYWNGGVRWVSLADSHRLDQIFIEATDKEISDLGIANSSAVKHTAGTVVLSRDAGVGKSAVLGSEMAVSQHFIAWRCSERLNNLFLYFKLQHMKPTFEAIALGSTVKTIGLDYFRKLRISVPARSEQDKAAEVMMAAEADVRSEQVELEKMRLLKSGLMDDLLTGRVRVTPLLAPSAP
jgi:type I restriction enzyme S subunit